MSLVTEHSVRNRRAVLRQSRNAVHATQFFEFLEGRCIRSLTDARRTSF
jgi:hypothetical protein